MYDIMRKYATESGGSPWGQDNQSIIAPARLTKDGGDIVSTRFMLGELTLPKRDTYYHLYQVGQISPVILGCSIGNLRGVKVSGVLSRTL